MGIYRGELQKGQLPRPESHGTASLAKEKSEHSGSTAPVCGTPTEKPTPSHGGSPGFSTASSRWAALRHRRGSNRRARGERLHFKAVPEYNFPKAEALQRAGGCSGTSPLLAVALISHSVQICWGGEKGRRRKRKSSLHTGKKNIIKSSSLNSTG